MVGEHDTNYTVNLGKKKKTYDEFKDEEAKGADGMSQEQIE